MRPYIPLQAGYIRYRPRVQNFYIFFPDPELLSPAQDGNIQFFPRGGYQRGPVLVYDKRFFANHYREFYHNPRPIQRRETPPFNRFMESAQGGDLIGKGFFDKTVDGHF
jgi:hypothetical protein